LMENGHKIYQLHNEVQRVTQAQKELDQSLELIYGKQTELHEMLGHLENEVEEMYKADSEMQPADEEREKGYRLAENVDAQLNQMGTTLKELITKINKMHDRSVDESNPVAQVIKILNVHLSHLQWIDQTTGALHGKIQEAQSQYKLRKVEQERIHHRRPY